jgi:hypothetical protein
MGGNSTPNLLVAAATVHIFIKRVTAAAVQVFIINFPTIPSLRATSWGLSTTIAAAISEIVKLIGAVKLGIVFIGKFIYD